MVDEIVESFSELSDIRRQGHVQHKLIDILVIAVSTVIADAETWADIAHYGEYGKPGGQSEPM